VTKPARATRRRWLAVALSGAAALVVGGLFLALSPSTRSRTATKPGGSELSVREAVRRDTVPNRGVRAKSDRQPTAEPQGALVTVATGNVTGTPATAPVSYPSPEAERASLLERLPGERLTLDHRARSLAAIERLLAGQLEGPERAQLERRKAILEGKQREQASRVARIEERLSILERP
jgi:hypothetical protein